MAQQVSRSFPGEDNLWQITNEKLAAAGLTVDDFEPAMAATEQAFEAANQALGHEHETSQSRALASTE